MVKKPNAQSLPVAEHSFTQGCAAQTWTEVAQGIRAANDAMGPYRKTMEILRRTDRALGKSQELVVTSANTSGANVNCRRS